MATVDLVPEGELFFENEAANVSPAFLGKAYGSNHIHLDTNQSVPYPIVHQLGSEIFANYADEGNTVWTDNGGDDWTGIGTVATRLTMVLSESMSSDESIVVSFNASIVSGSCVILTYYNGTSWIPLDAPYTIVSGLNKIEIKGRNASGTKFSLDDNTFEIDFTSNSVKEITTTDSFVSYYDVATKQRIQIADQDNGSNSSVKFIENGDFSDGLTGWVAGSGAVLSIENNELKILATPSDSTAYATQATSLNTGRRYAWLASIKETTSTRAYIIIDGKTVVDDSPAIAGDFGGNITFDGTNEIKLQNASADTAPDYTVFDNISVKEVLPISTTYNITTSHSDYMAHSKALTVAELAECNTGVNVMAQVWFDGRVLVDGFAKADIEYYPMSNEGLRGGKFVQDLTEVSMDPTTSYTGKAGGGVNNTVTNNGNTFTIHQESADSQVYYPECKAINTNSTPGEHTIFIFNVKIFNGTARARITSVGHLDQSTNSLAINETWGVGEYQIIRYGNYRGDDKAYISFDGSHVDGTEFDAEVEILIFQFTAYEIANYTEACRTTLQNVQYGSLSNLGLLQDASGRTISTMPSGSIAVDAGGKHVDSEFNVDGLTAYTIEQKISGLLQNFGSDSKQSATTTPVDCTESPSHLYTCAISTGDIEELSTETSGNVKINYTLSSTSAGSAGGNSTDGTYEAVIAFDGVIALVGYTGVLTVNSVNGLTTTSQRTENRVLTLDSGTVKYFIETVEQDVVPPLPTGIIKGTNTAILGYSDEVNIIYDPLRIDLYARTQAEILED